MGDPAGHPHDRTWAAFHSAARLLRIADELWLIPIGIFAVGIVAFELIPNTLDWRGPLWFLFLALMATALGVRVLAQRRIRSFKCPRCRAPFVRQQAPLAAIGRRLPCQHCGLPVDGRAPQA